MFSGIRSIVDLCGNHSFVYTSVQYREFVDTSSQDSPFYDFLYSLYFSLLENV